MGLIKEENLYTIGRVLIDRAIKEGNIKNSVFEYSEIKNAVVNAFKEEEAILAEMSQNIAITYLKKFLKAPQINNIMTSYIRYATYSRVAYLSKKDYKEPEKEILVGDVINYFLQVLATNFPVIPENEVVIIKSFVEIIANACSSFNIHKDAFSRSFFIEKSIRDIYHVEIFRASVDIHGILINASNKLKYELNSDFIPQNPKYNSMRAIYSKDMKNVYQMAFVYLLGEYKLNEFYISPLIFHSRGFKEAFHNQGTFRNVDKETYRSLRAEWRNLFVSNDIIYVVGGPGFGKSLFLKNIINNYDKLNIDSCGEYLLIYCDLKAFYSKGDPNKKSVMDFLQESMVNSTGLDVEKISKEFIQYHIDLGRCVILLDALDEVPKDVRGELHRKMVGYFSTCNPNNKICITSRDRGFLPHADIEVFEICPLNSMDIEDYLDKLISIKKFKKDDKECFMEQAQILIEKNFLNNFLALSLLTSIYKSEKKLPENKTNLYKKCFEYIAKEREIEEKNQTGFNWRNVAPLMKDSTFINLATLGVPNNKDIDRKEVEQLLLKQYRNKYSDDAETESAIKEFLDFCSSRTELFVPSQVDDKFKFFHRSFFEYFYSRYIHQCTNVEEMYELMSVFDVDSEVFELTVALVKEDNETKYQKLILHILSKVKEGLEETEKVNTAFNILTLAMQVIDDVYFKECYFELIIKYSSSFISQLTDEFNHRLVATWISNVLYNDSEKLEIFKDEYEESCIIFLLKLFSPLTREHLREINNYKISILLFPEYSFANQLQKVPFYVLVYIKYVNLFEKMEDYIKLPNSKIGKTFNSLSRREREEVKMGKNIYKSLKIEIRKQVCEMISKLR